MRPGFTLILPALLSILLGGCVTVAQQAIPFSAPVSTGETQVRIGVATTALPKVDTQFPGASCLLCLGAAALANSSLTSYSHTLPYEDLANLRTDAADALRRKGVDVVVIPENLLLNLFPKNKAKGANLSPRNFSALKAKYGIDKLLVIDVTGLGFVRNYAAYIPTSDPQAWLSGLGYMVDLKTNQYEWYMPVSIVRSAEGAWSEPPKFPGLTNAYFQAITIGRDQFLQPLGQ